MPSPTNIGSPLQGQAPRLRLPCPKCQTLITDSHMERHRKSDTCQKRYLQHLLQERVKGMVLIDTSWDQINRELACLANYGAIPGAFIHGYHYQAYIPAWVDRAFRLWKSNDGYAQMAFLEFLKALGPETGKDV